MQIGKEELKLSFSDDRIQCVENPKDFIKKMLELINNFNKVVG